MGVVVGLEMPRPRSALLQKDTKKPLKKLAVQLS